MDHVSRISTFLEVVRLESFSAAARELGITGPAVSKQVQSLEQQLGVNLLYRTTRKVSLTEEGSMYYQRASKALADLNEAEQQLKELQACPTGRLKVNAPMSFGRQFMTGPIASFAKQYPDVELDVDFDDRWVDVIGEGFDVVIRIGVLEDSTLVARKLARCPIVLCASKSLLGSVGVPESIADLDAFPGVIYSKHGQSEEWRYQNVTGKTGSYKLPSGFSANSAEMQLEACLQGVGIGLLPIFSAAEHLKSGELVRILPDYSTFPERGIYALYPQNRFVATRVRLFIDWLVDCSKEFPWQD